MLIPVFVSLSVYEPRVCLQHTHTHTQFSHVNPKILPYANWWHYVLGACVHEWVFFCHLSESSQKTELIFFLLAQNIFCNYRKKNCRNEVSTDYFSTLKRETMQAYCVSKTEWTLVEWMACGSRLCCCTAPTYITHFIGFVAFSPSLAHFSHITSIKWDLVFLSYNLLSLPLCHSLSLFPIYISLSLQRLSNEILYLPESLFLFHCTSLQATWPHRNKEHQMFFSFFHHLNSFPPLPFTQPHFFNFHIFILIFRDTLCHCSSPCTTSPLLSPYSLSANIIHFLSLHLNNSPLHNLLFLKDTKVRSFPTRTVGFVSYLVLAHWCLLLLTFASVLDYI